MPVDTKTVARWSPADWDRSVKMVLPSSDGAQGVLFVFTTAAAKYSIGNTDFVIKPITGSAATARFAEEVLAKGAKATSLQSQEVKPSSPLGRAIQATLDRYVADYDKTVAARSDRVDAKAYGDGSTRAMLRSKNVKQVARAFFKARRASDSATYPAEHIDRLRELARTCKGAGTLLVQQFARGMQTMDDALEDRGLLAVLGDLALMRNLGMLFVADQVLGNGDRLDQSINMGNLAFGADGTLFAIDSATVLASFDALLDDVQQGTGAAGASYTDMKGQLTGASFGEASMRGAKGAPTLAEAQALKGGTAHTDLGTSKAMGTKHVLLAPTAQLDLLFHPDRVWDSFRRQCEGKLRDINAERRKQNLPAYLPPTPSDWANAFEAFNAGVLKGLKRVDNLLSGMSWLRTKSRFKALAGKHGRDVNMDYTNFKLRRLVVHLARKGVPLNIAESQAVAYAQRKFTASATF